MDRDHIIGAAKLNDAASFLDLLDASKIDYTILEMCITNPNDGFTNIIPRVPGFEEGESMLFINGEFMP